jgi:phytanoyl-CoA hydroxylase
VICWSSRNQVEEESILIMGGAKMGTTIEEYGALREKYDLDGYVLVEQAIDNELVQEARSHVDWLLAKHPDVRPEQLGHTMMKGDAFWVRLVGDDRLLDIAEQFIGPDIALFASHYIAKRPFDGQEVLWHQDGSFWPLEPMEVVTLWLAVDDVDRENGCMRVVPGTQETRLLTLEELQDRDDGMNVLGKGMDPAQIDESKAVDVVLKAGGVEIHHPNIIHGSNANTSPRWRRGLTIRYIPAGTRIVSDEIWPSAFILRGNPVPGRNRYNPWPQFVGGENIPFHNWPEWNRRAAEWNRRTPTV